MAKARKIQASADRAGLRFTQLDIDHQLRLCKVASMIVERCGIACPGGLAIIPCISLVPPVSFSQSFGI